MKKEKLVEKQKREKAVRCVFLHIFCLPCALTGYFCIKCKVIAKEENGGCQWKCARVCCGNPYRIGAPQEDDDGVSVSANAVQT